MTIPESTPIDPQQAVSLQVTNSLETMAEYDDDALAELAESFRKEADHLFRLARGAHEELRQRMIDRGAKVLETEHWSGKLTPGRSFHTVDAPDRFRQRLADLLGEEEIAAAFVRPPPPPMRVDYRVINELDKRGGQISQIIAEERRTVKGEDQLVLRRKAQHE